MSREKKKGTSGNAKAFITRAKALKKLQLSLQEFRRLCILKGIYPRDPRKKLEGSDKTYYLRKDIDFLAHERLIETIRQQNSHKKKEIKARAKRRIDVLKRLALSKPKARLDHLVVERYPQFTDAIRELDDPLCVIALFANLPADHKVGIAPKRVSNCQRLLREFHNFVAETNALKRVFVSIKGYYYQARVEGETVTWVTPHRFSQILPADVDYSVMLTFLELYECILSFVNFRLYTTKNLAYPPKISRVADARGLELASVETEAANVNDAVDVLGGNMDVDEPVGDAFRVSENDVEKAQKLALTVQPAEESDEDEDDKSGGDEGVDDGNTGTEEKNVGEERDERVTVLDASPGVFAGKSFVLGREVPYVELEFALKASGALKVTREDDLMEGPKRTASYTHWVIDRPEVLGERDMALDYVQPQYVFDSVNAAVLLPTSLYAPGANLPPHLSPFVTDEDDGGYRPWFKDVLERIKAGDTSVVAEAAAVVYAEGEAKSRKTSDEKTGVTPLGKVTDEKESGENTHIQGGPQPESAEVTSDENKSEPTGTSMPKTDCRPQAINVAKTGQLDEEREDSDSSDEGDDEESDEEEEEQAEAEREATIMEKEGNELATLMLSRKKMRQYKKHKREEHAKTAVKERLTAKRKNLEGESVSLLKGKSAHKRRRAR